MSRISPINTTGSSGAADRPNALQRLSSRGCSPALLDFSTMKGLFSIEWLSQSSQAPPSAHPAHPAPDTPNTSGTASESLPGFYSRWRVENTDGPETTRENREENIIRPLAHAEAGFSSSAEEEETSGYESEGGRSLSPGAPKAAAPSVSPSTGRRPRTAFTAEQISSLERAFKRNAYLGAQDKAELCKRLSLSDKQIRNWFQNRRMKLKRTVQDSLAHACQAKVASHMLHYSDLHAFRAAPYPGYYPALQESPSAYGVGLHYGPAAALPVDGLFPYGGLQSLSFPPYHTPY